jgi:heavy metal sensor kinase
MLESLRARLLLWYTLILALVIGAFGGTVSYLFWRSLVVEADAELLARARTVARVLRPAAPGSFDLDLPDDAVQYFYQPAGGQPYYAIWNANGELIDQSDPALDIQIPRVPGVYTRRGRREVVIDAERGVTVLVGRDVADLRQEVWSLEATIGGVSLLALAVSLLGGWFLSGRALAPIARISRTATAMAAGDLSARIAIDRTESELGQLASTLNGAFDRLLIALERQRRFTADASHELRTPLATLSAETEWALARERTAADYRASLEICSRAAARMRAVVEALLTLARADAGEIQFRRAPVALGPIIHDVVSLLRGFADRRKVSIAVQDGPAVVTGDTELLREVVSNLVSNAIQYNHEGGRVDICVLEEGPVVCLRVADSGIGIAPEDLPRVFDRFYRADKVRARDAGGVGLGLALTKWIVEGHDGQITCSSEVGLGTQFVVRLPPAQQA